MSHPRDRVQTLLALGGLLVLPWAAFAQAGDEEGPVSPSVAALTSKDGEPQRTFALTKQDGQPLAPDYFQALYTVVTFFETRCVAPESCSVVSGKFQKLESLVADDPGLDGRVQLLSVSLDPTHDTPRQLRDHSSKTAAGAKHWTFVTGDAGSVASFAAAYQVPLHADGPTGAHQPVTLLLAPGGSLLRRMEGTNWDPAAVLQLINAQPR